MSSECRRKTKLQEINTFFCSLHPSLRWSKGCTMQCISSSGSKCGIIWSWVKLVAVFQSSVDFYQCCVLEMLHGISASVYWIMLCMQINYAVNLRPIPRPPSAVYPHTHVIRPAWVWVWNLKITLTDYSPLAWYTPAKIRTLLQNRTNTLTEWLFLL